MFKCLWEYHLKIHLEEVHLDSLNERVPSSIRGFWPRLIARALLADLGPVLVFAPQRKAAEKMARQIAGALPRCRMHLAEFRLVLGFQRNCPVVNRPEPLA